MADIDNMDQLNKKITHFQKLLEISEHLHSTLNVETLIKRAIAVSKEFFDSEDASLMLWDEEKQCLYFEYIDSPAAEALKKIKLKKGEGIAGCVAESSKPLIVNEAGKDERFSGKGDAVSKIKTRNILCAPLIAENKTIGVMSIINKKNSGFTADDQFLCTGLANIIAAAIANAELHKKVNESLQKITELESSKTNFISVLSHELKTPLTSIKGYVDLLAGEDIDHKEQEEYKKVIARETNRLNSIIGDIFVVNEIDDIRNTLSAQDIDLVALVNEVADFWKQSAYNHNFIISPDDKSINIKADKEKIIHCLNHIIDNAVKFSPDGGDIIINIKKSGDFAEVAVKDNGIGIATECCEKIFDKFYQIDNTSTRCFEGMGNGLYICKKIAEAHNGKINVESISGKGSIFTLTLPVFK